MGPRELETAHHVNDHKVARILLDVDDQVVRSILAANSGLDQMTACITTGFVKYRVDKLLLIQVVRKYDTVAAGLRRHCLGYKLTGR
jgi:hypothetical protein